MKYDFLIVGSGLFGAVFAYEATQRGRSCMVVEKRSHIGGNIFSEYRDGIGIHRYGAHIFHTGMKNIWDYVRKFACFNQYINCPVANYKGEIYNLPFNMNTFYRMWGVLAPQDAERIIKQQRSEIIGEPQNLEEQAISMVGRDIYEKLIKGYTEKQWGRSCRDLPTFIIQRLPVRYTYDNNYFGDPYQGIPIGGYTPIIEKMLSHSHVVLNADFNINRNELKYAADMIVYTGATDAYFDYCYGALEYRGLYFETQRLETDNYQGVAVMNYTDKETPYTRIIEHKHFEFGKQPITYVTKEYPVKCDNNQEPYYPINDDRNQELFNRYRLLQQKEENVLFGGRLSEYRYYNMDQTIASALELVNKIT